MVHKRKISISIIGIILMVGIIFTTYLIYQSRPKHVIESRLKFRLPSDSEIVNYSYDYNGGYFDTKIVIGDKSVSDVIEQLNSFFGEVAPKKAIESMPSFKNTCSWWDLNNQILKLAMLDLFMKKCGSDILQSPMKFGHLLARIKKINIICTFRIKV